MTEEGTLQICQNVNRGQLLDRFTQYYYVVTSPEVLTECQTSQANRGNVLFVFHRMLSSMFHPLLDSKLAIN